MSKGEFKSLSANESEIWTCKVCEMKDQMRLEGVTLCGSCESLMARWQKKHHGNKPGTMASWYTRNGKGRVRYSEDKADDQSDFCLGPKLPL